MGTLALFSACELANRAFRCRRHLRNRLTVAAIALSTNNEQKVQLLLLAEYRDETTTRHAVQRALDWLNRSGEEQFLAERAKARRAIILTIAEQLDTGSAYPSTNHAPSV